MKKIINNKLDYMETTKENGKQTTSQPNEKRPSTKIEINKDELKSLVHKFYKGKDIKVYGATKLEDPGKSKKAILVKCSYCNKEIEKTIINYHKESHPTKILDWLFLGSYNNATNFKELNYADIKYILNCAGECKNLFQENFKYKHLKLSDYSDDPIEHHFEDAIEFIEEARANNKKIFVHCQVGKSRSASMVIAYLMKSEGLSVDEAFKKVKALRKMILPNLGFMKKLREFEKKLLNGKI